MRWGEPLIGAMSIFQNHFEEFAAVLTHPDDIKACICQSANLTQDRNEKRLDFALAEP